MNEQLRKAWVYLAPFVLIGVATVQHYRAHVHGLSAWKGGGFGMFSTVDTPGARYLRAYVVRSGAELEVPMPTELSPRARKVRTVPSVDGLEGIARELRDTTWLWAEYDVLAHVLSGDSGPFEPVTWPDPAVARPPSEQPRIRSRAAGEPEPPPEARVRFDSLRLELWRIRFDGSSGRVHNTKWLEVSLAAGEPS